MRTSSNLFLSCMVFISGSLFTMGSALAQDTVDGGAPAPAPATNAPVAAEPAPAPAPTTTAAPIDMPPASQEEGELALFELEEVWNTKVVTASGKEEGAATAAANVYVVTRDDILARGYQSVAEALANVPGLHVIDDMVQPSLAVRGVTGGYRSGSRIVRVMINGAEINYRPSLTALIGPEFLPIGVVERIEVAKGPLSALYGANAFLATVNVITRTPKAASTTGELAMRHSRINANTSAGAPGYDFGAYGSFDGERGSLTVAASISSLDRSGLTVRKTFDAQSLIMGNTEFLDRTSRKDIANPLSAYAAGVLKLGTMANLRLQAGAQILDSISNFRAPSLFTNRSRVSLQNLWTDTKLDVTFNDKWSGDLRFTFTDSRHRAAEQQFLTDNFRYTFYPQDAARTFDSGANLRWSPLDWMSFAGGLQFIFEDHDVLF